MNIVFNVNPLGMEGLGSTLTSLIRNCSDNSKLTLCFLCSELKTKDKNNIRQLLQDEFFKGNIDFFDFNAKQIFGHLKSLHGDWTAYGRLLIPAYIKSDNALYLDSDLVINADILAIQNFTTNNILSAVNGGPVLYALDNPFFIKKLNWKPDTAYFNSGVLFFNIAAWKATNIDKKVKELTDKYPNELISHDQTLLNAVCEGNFGHLPNEFNLPWYPDKAQPANADKAIIHFVGSPKPWDLFGKIIHEGNGTWKTYNTKFWKNQYGNITVPKLIRTWEIRRSILKNLKSKLTKK